MANNFRGGQLRRHSQVNTADKTFSSCYAHANPLSQTDLHVTQMALTVYQALQQGVAAHKEGKLQDAEGWYRAILRAQPNHPEANHNLGLLALAVGKPLDSVPLFRLAVETNPKKEQFWLSYIDALLKVEHFNDAEQALRDGEQFGVSAEKLGGYSQRVQSSRSERNNKPTKVQTLSEARNEAAEKTKNRKKMAKSMGR